MSAGRVILVTGASSGVGRAAAHRLAVRGDRLVLAARGKAALDAAAEECRRRGAASVLVVPTDVGDATAVERLVESVVHEHGRIDGVLHCAGVVAYGRFEDVPAEIFDGVLGTNVAGSANLARAVLPVLRKQKAGTLVLVGSVLGDIAAPQMTPYAVSKAAVRSLGRQLAIENRDLPGVHVCVFSLGPADTPIYRQAANYMGRRGRPPVPVVSADSAARDLVHVLDRPRDRVNSGVANPLMRAGFTLAPRLFDVLVGPAFRLTALRPESVPPTAGNVLRPRDEWEAVDGGEGHGVRDLLGRLVGR